MGKFDKIFEYLPFGVSVMSGRICELNFYYEIPGIHTEGKSMILYYAATKIYTGWWFDGSNPGTMKQNGLAIIRASLAVLPSCYNALKVNLWHRRLIQNLKSGRWILLAE
jgi:hypothetical protein